VTLITRADTADGTPALHNLLNGPLDQRWAPRLEALLGAGTAAGADLVEVFLERTDHLGVLAEQDTITSVTPAFGMGAGIRVFRNQRDGFVCTNDLSEAGLQRALEQALGMLGLELGGLNRNPFAGLPALRDFAASKGDWLQRSPELLEATQALLGGTNQLQNHGQHLQVRRGSYARDWQEVLVAASDGTFGRDIRLHQSVGLNVLAADGDHRAGVGRRYGSADRPDDLREWQVEDSAQEVCDRRRHALCRLRGGGPYAGGAGQPLRRCDLPRGLRASAGNHPGGARHHPLRRARRRTDRPQRRHRHR